MTLTFIVWMIKDEALPLAKLRNIGVGIDVFSFFLGRISREQITDLVGDG